MKQSSGVGTGWVLLIVFVTLKLTENVTWGWGWVLAPLWVPLVLAFFYGAGQAMRGR